MLLPHWHRPCPGLSSAPVLLTVPWPGSGPAEAASSIRDSTHLQGEICYQHRAKLRSCVVVSFPLITHVNGRSFESCKLDQFSPIGCQQWQSRELLGSPGGVTSSWHLFPWFRFTTQSYSCSSLMLGEIAFARSTFSSLRVAQKVFQHGNPSMLHVQYKCQRQSCFSPCALDAVCREPEH